jgi:adenylate kinase
VDQKFTIDEIDAIASWLGTGSINIFGMPFAGKDTQGRILADMFDGPLLGGGDILRNSVVPKRTKEALKKGLLVPTEDYVNIVLPYLGQVNFKERPLILSSVGRWHGEEESVMKATAKSGHPVKAIFYLKITEEEVQKRWAKSQEDRSKGDRGSRGDDHAAVLEVRLKEFKEKTLPVIDYYRAADQFYEINAGKHAVEVTAEILRILHQQAKKQIS